MASNINANNINGAYPIAGQDNDSQGFRVNFTNIKNNLASAKVEIEDLQSKVVLKAPLTGNSTTTNDFNGVVMTGGVLSGFTETKYEFIDPVAPNISPLGIELSFAMGDNQLLRTNGPVSLTFIDWPLGTTYAKMRVMVDVLHLGDNITLPAEVTVGVNKIPGFTALTSTITTAVGQYFFEFSTFNGGSTIIVVPLVTP